MRRLDLHPLKRLRNPERHLRALRRWRDNAHLFLPSQELLEQCGRYYNIKLPVFQKLVTPRHTNPAIVRECISSLIIAAQNIRAGVKLQKPFRLAVLIDSPHYFWSEVTLFFDQGYLASFYPPKTYGTTKSGNYISITEPPRSDLLAELGFTLPNDFISAGGYHLISKEKDDADSEYKCDRWIFVERKEAH